MKQPMGILGNALTPLPGKSSNLTNICFRWVETTTTAQPVFEVVFFETTFRSAGRSRRTFQSLCSGTGSVGDGRIFSTWPDIPKRKYKLWIKRCPSNKDFWKSLQFVHFHHFFFQVLLVCWFGDSSPIRVSFAFSCGSLRSTAPRMAPFNPQPFQWAKAWFGLWVWWMWTEKTLPSRSLT